MRETPYFSIRSGRNPNAVIGLAMARKLFLAVFRDFWRRDYFQEAFGYECVDEGPVPGSLGWDIESHLLLRLRKSSLWPIEDSAESYTEDDLFDVIEFLYDCISLPLDGTYHSYNNCGYHYTKFDSAPARVEFRSGVNSFLRDFGSGYLLSDKGEILTMPEEGTQILLFEELPDFDERNVNAPVARAISKFLRHRSTIADRGDAVRDLADVLEFLRPRARSIIVAADESDLFNIANNFGIRHRNDRQRTGFDQEVWTEWVFYYYLATIRACVRILNRTDSA